MVNSLMPRTVFPRTRNIPILTGISGLSLFEQRLVRDGVKLQQPFPPDCAEIVKVPTDFVLVPNARIPDGG
jgi:hypothetical protein